MKAVGHMTVAVDQSGEKCLLKGVHWNDLKVEVYLSEVLHVGCDLEDLLFAEEILEVLRSKGTGYMEIRNCLVLMAFSYQSIESFNGETTGYEDNIVVEDVMILDPDHKRTWKNNLDLLYRGEPLEEVLKQEDVREWMEFYDEEFAFTEEKPSIPGFFL